MRFAQAFLNPDWAMIPFGSIDVPISTLAREGISLIFYRIHNACPSNIAR